MIAQKEILVECGNGKNIKTRRNWCNCIEIVQPEECLQLFRVPVECAMIDQPQKR